MILPTVIGNVLGVEDAVFYISAAALAAAGLGVGAFEARKARRHRREWQADATPKARHRRRKGHDLPPASILGGLGEVKGQHVEERPVPFPEELPEPFPEELPEPLPEEGPEPPLGEPPEAPPEEGPELSAEEGPEPSAEVGPEPPLDERPEPPQESLVELRFPKGLSPSSDDHDRGLARSPVEPLYYRKPHESIDWGEEEPPAQHAEDRSEGEEPESLAPPEESLPAGEAHEEREKYLPEDMSRSEGAIRIGEPAPRRGPARYANVLVLDPEARPLVSIAPGQVVSLRVDIGALDPHSLVEEAVPFPEVAPSEDLMLDVLLSSNDFDIGLTDGELGESSAVEQRLRLPAGGGAALSEDGTSRFIHFLLRAPERPGSARARLIYLYRNTVLQSQRLDAELGNELTVTTDFTISERMGADVLAIPQRPRVTLVVTESGGERHELTVRAGDAAGAPLTEPVAFSIKHESIGPTVAELRKRLGEDSPKARRQSRDQLIRNLRRAAPLGRALYSALDPCVQDAVRDAPGAPGETVLQVAMTKGSTFTIPWSFVYDIYLPSSVPPERLEICPLVDTWDGQRPMVEVGARSCPHADDPGHDEGTLCPFGFWGYRYGIELLSNTDKPGMAIHCGQGGRVVIGETQKNIDKDRLETHVETLKRTFESASSALEVCEAATSEKLRDLIAADLPIIYFLCHGQRGAKTVELGLGRDERIAPDDLIGWIDLAAKRTRHLMWTDPRPLVFINACASLAITPEDLVDYLDAFIGKGHAVGLIGTEIRVEPRQAMELAETFFAKLFEPGATVDAALRHIRTSFLAAGNLLGLAYTPYCFADLAVTRAGRSQPSGE